MQAKADFLAEVPDDQDRGNHRTEPDGPVVVVGHLVPGVVRVAGVELLHVDAQPDEDRDRQQTRHDGENPADEAPAEPRSGLREALEHWHTPLDGHELEPQDPVQTKEHQAGHAHDHQRFFAEGHGFNLPKP